MSGTSKPAPAMVWPLADYLAEEMDERGWTCVDVARRMPGEYSSNIGVINVVLACCQKEFIVSKDLAKRIATAFDVSPQYILKLHQVWTENPAARQPFECPNHLLDGLEFPEPAA